MKLFVKCKGSEKSHFMAATFSTPCRHHFQIHFLKSCPSGSGYLASFPVRQHGGRHTRNTYFACPRMLPAWADGCNERLFVHMRRHGHIGSVYLQYGDSASWYDGKIYGTSCLAFWMMSASGHHWSFPWWKKWLWTPTIAEKKLMVALTSLLYIWNF